MANSEMHKGLQQPHFVEERPRLLSIMQTERIVIGYGITEDELEHLSSLNTQSTSYFSAASACFAIAISIFVSWLMGGQPPDLGRVLALIGAPIIAFIIGGTFIFLAIKAVRTRGSMVKRIKAQSKPMQA